MLFGKKGRALYPVVLGIALSLLFSPVIADEPAGKKIIIAGSQAEWLPAKEILMHTPGDELFLGIIHPDAALFEKTFSIAEAAREHQNYIRLLKKNGIRVHTVVETLLEGTLDAYGKTVRGPQLDRLRSFARQFITVDASSLARNEQKKQGDYLESVMLSLTPRDLVKIILNQPIVRLKKTVINTGYEAHYELRPVMNLYFLRDQMITTSRGVVICKMNSPQREAETKIIKFVLSKLRIQPLHEIQGSGRLEGGDFIPAGDTVFIGRGVRTNAEAVKQLMDNRVFGSKRVVVVNEKWKNQVQMHLDTYFNVISKDLAVLVEDRLYSSEEKNYLKHLTADIYELENGWYRLQSKDEDFVEFLRNTMKMTILPVTNSDQLKYGINFLTIAKNKIIGVDGVSRAYKDALKYSGVQATWMDFSNMTGGYGAAHCVTQVLRRESAKK